MKVLMAHNFYQQPGGEDQSFLAEAGALREAGVEVIKYTVHNDTIAQSGRLRTAVETIWSRRTTRAFRSLLRSARPDIVHLQNTFPLISPSAVYAARGEGVPVVQSLRNYRLICPNGLLFRDGGICEKCLHTRTAWPAAWHRCYRDSAAGSAVVAGMLTVHRALGTWTDCVDQFIALTRFARDKLIEAGLPASRISVKPNFVTPDPLPGAGDGGFALFIGRLSQEKGLGTLLAAWHPLGGRLPLKIVGDGPLAPLVRDAAAADRSIEWLGRKPIGEVYDLAGRAKCLVFPSEWYETFGRVAIEAFAKGTPVIASRLGAMTELVDEGRTGFLFSPGDCRALLEAVEKMLALPALRYLEMRREARLEYERHYTAPRNVQMLCDIYRNVIAARPAAQADVPSELALSGRT